MDKPVGAVAIIAGGQGAPGAELSEEELAMREHEERQKHDMMLARLDALGASLARTRSQAINARQSSGIEDIWYEDEEFYQGIDNANRGEMKSAWRTKPPGQTAASEQTTANQTRSTVFPNITGPYVDAASARISDMLLPTDDRNYALKETPIPEAVGASQGKYSPDMLREVAAMYPGQPELAKKELALATQAALEVIAEAKAKAEKAQTRIDDWLVECQWHSQVRLVIEDAARIGTGILKGPVPTNNIKWAYKDGRLVKSSTIKPGSKRIDPWNFYPDGACGENIQNGSFTWERDHITRKRLRELIGQEGYIEEQILRCLEEGPMLAVADTKLMVDPVTDENKKDNFEIWYFHGTAEREDLEAAGCDCGEERDPHVPAMLTIVNNHVIRASLNPLDTGEYPYDVMVWRHRAGHWTGSGVGRQVRVPQRMVTAATRNLMDNAGLAAGPIIVFRQGVVYGSDGDDTIKPRKVFYVAQDADEYADATKAIGVIKVDMLVAELTQIIELGLKFAEHCTGLPLLLQGHMGEAPDTLGGMQMLNTNASTTLRRMGKLFDDRITEPHVRRYYHWLLQYGEDEEKGDYCIDARGSSALVERDIQNQAVMQMGNIVTNPIFGLDPKKWAEEFLKSQRLDAKRFKFDDEQWQKIVESMSQGPQDPRLAVAQLRAQAEERVKMLDGNIKKELLMLEQRFEDFQAERDRQLEVIIADLERAGKKEISLDTLKTKLADTTIKTRTQRDLSAMSARREALKPPSEPKGRAPAGQSFQR